LLTKLLSDAVLNPAAIPAVVQDLGKRQYYGKEVPQGGQLCWAKPARDIVNFVRACDYSPYPSPWGHPKTSIAGVEMEIVKVSLTSEPCFHEPGTLGDCSESGVKIAAADEWVCIRRIKIGKERVSPRQVLESVTRSAIVSQGQQ
jgi:methionyl-tRNA formyltransferase